MAFSRSVFTVLLISVACKASNVPVFLWGDLAVPSSKTANPLMTTESLNFRDILSHQLMDNPFTVVFIEQTLSTEDLSHRNADGETSFPYLKSLHSSVYLPSVENAMDVFDRLEDSKKITLTEDGLSGEILPVTGKFLFIYMKDAIEGESRAELLRRHNDFMEETFTKLVKEGISVVAVYTAPQESWVISHSRVRRQTSSNSTSDYLLDGLRLYAKNIKVTNGANTVTLQGLTSYNTDINSTGLTLKSTLNFPDNSIVLNFKGVGGYWFFSE